MAKKEKNGSVCCLTLPLQLEKWQEDRLNKRFECARQIYNSMVAVQLKALRRLEHDPEYRAVQQQLAELARAEKKSSDDWKEAGKRKSAILKKAGMSKYGFKGRMKDCYKHFGENIGSSVAVHCIAERVWIAFEKMIYKNGEKVHFKKPGEMDSIEGYSVSKKSGGTEIIFHGTYIEWKKLRLKLKLDPSNQYEQEMLSRWVKRVRICRKSGKTRDRWYAQLILEGKPAIKCDAVGQPLHPVGRGNVGIDIGPQTIAYVAEQEVDLRELADQVQSIENEKRLLQRKMDRSRRACNPNNYTEDGSIKRGVRLTHNKSRRYLALQKKLSFLQYKQAAVRKRQHNELANHLLSLGDHFFVEDMDWAALARRASKTEISEKTGRYKRKKRFGKSLANKAPAMLIDILTRKCEQLGLPGVEKVGTRIRASQYNHMTDTYQKKPLSQRWNEMPDGHRIQRDLYSAFLLQHTIAPENKAFDKQALRQDYAAFANQHDTVISRLSAQPKTLSSIGIRRTYR